MRETFLVPSDNRENKNFNMGLLNLGNEKMGDGINIIIYVIAAICIMMLFKWMKQCYKRRQEKMIRQMQLVQMKMQPLQPLQVPDLAAPVAQPAYRSQYRYKILTVS